MPGFVMDHGVQEAKVGGVNRICHLMGSRSRSAGHHVSQAATAATSIRACIAVLMVLHAGATAAEDPAAADAAPAHGDWYCVGYDAGHSYTSPDSLLPPLKVRWTWTPPANTTMDLLHAVSSNGKVFAHSHAGGCHNWMLDLETGACDAKDPGGLTPNDLTRGFPIGTAGGIIYQSDDGGPGFVHPDVWSPMQVSASLGLWAVVQQSRVDGDNPGIYCQKLGVWIGEGWFSGVPVPARTMGTLCVGNISMGADVLYATTQWTIPGDGIVNGLSCHELNGGKRRWKLDGKFIAVSAGTDWCVAIDQRFAMVLVSAAEGKVLSVVTIPSLPECPPMVVGNNIRLYDEQGDLTTYTITEKGGKTSLKVAGRKTIGRFAGNRVEGRYNCPFCFSADGTMYVANGDVVGGLPADPKAKRWLWNPPGDLAHVIGQLGHPIIAHGKLIVVGKGGVICFESQGPPRVPAK
jgi:hypothetical protein